MRDRQISRDDRSQAFTLEGFIASVVILTAVLFALQSIVLVPGTAGDVDQEVRSQQRTKANDILKVSAHNSTGNLSYVVRHWNGSDTEETWAGAINDQVGYGPNSQPPTVFGELINESYSGGEQINVIVEYRKPDQRTSEELRMVYRGVPSDRAIVTTYTVTLFDNDTLTGPDADDTELWNYPTDPADASPKFYPIPDAFPDSPIYNVVEVRVVIWG